MRIALHGARQQLLLLFYVDSGKNQLHLPSVVYLQRSLHSFIYFLFLFFYFFFRKNHFGLPMLLHIRLLFSESIVWFKSFLRCCIVQLVQKLIATANEIVIFSHILSELICLPPIIKTLTLIMNYAGDAQFHDSATWIVGYDAPSGLSPIGVPRTFGAVLWFECG